MQPEIDRILQEIANDTVSGASTLAGRGLDAIEHLEEQFLKDDTQAENSLIRVVRALDEIRPSMGAIGVQAVLAASRARALHVQGLPWKSAVKQAVIRERETLGHADGTITAITKQELGTGGTWVSCSWSKTTQGVLVALEPDQVRMGEGHRSGDGIRGAKWLAARGIRVEVVPDGALPTAVEGAKAVLVGADQVLADGSVVNRCSTFSLALAARFYNIPFYVVCQRIKLGGQKEAVIEESKRMFRALPKGVTARAPVFDVTPAPLVYRIITESGSLTTDEAAEVGRGIARLKDAFLS